MATAISNNTGQHGSNSIETQWWQRASSTRQY